jgi:putative addiction module CopG family antidote
MADMIRGKVESGEYASESEVIRDGLRALLARDRAMEHWLREEVAPAYDAMKSGKSKTFSAEQMRTALKDHHEEREHTGKKKRP